MDGMKPDDAPTAARLLEEYEQAFANLCGLSLSEYSGVVEDLMKARAARDTALDALIAHVVLVARRDTLREMPCELHPMEEGAEIDSCLHPDAHPELGQWSTGGPLRTGMCERCHLLADAERALAEASRDE